MQRTELESLLLPALLPLSTPPTGLGWNHPELSDIHDCQTALNPAAVLVPIRILHGAAPSVIFTRRSAALSNHAGQICFPGGRIEHADENAIHTALRETHEEIGISAEIISPLGYLDLYDTITGFRVTPILALVQGPVEYRPDPTEVDEVIEVPLEFLLDARNVSQIVRHFRGRDRTTHAFRFGSHQIWGATAGMMVNLLSRMGRWKL